MPKEGRTHWPRSSRRASVEVRTAVTVASAAAWLLVAGAGGGPLPTASAATVHAGAQVLNPSSIRSQQDNVVTANHQGPLSLAQLAVSEFSSAVTTDTNAVAADRAAQATAAARAAAAATRLSSDRSVLAAAVSALDQANGRLSTDRHELRDIAVGMYTGALTNPQPVGVQALEAEQQQVIDAAEVELVARVVEGHLRQDLATATTDARHRAAAARQVQDDQEIQTHEAAMAVAAAARTAADQTALIADQRRLAGANSQLDAVEAQLAAALASVAGPSSVPPGELSILGGSALSAKQLTGWYNAQGYVDLTTAPIGPLAAWYIQAGAEEGVRGDVAFAQAVLETGGFSSPDAVDLSNFAGIGHCDTCAAGWAFPSPQAGVLGHVQLLRIFATSAAGPPSAPPPVLPSLTPGQQMSAGCCSTVERLTGVWATDPAYDQQILDIYGQMLSYALASNPTA